MKFLISGSSGMVGSALVFSLLSNGHQIHRLVRSREEDGIYWNPQESLEASALEGFDSVIHLAGENIAEGRWNEEKKRRIRESRVTGTRHLSEALAKLKSPPSSFVCASASGYYGNRGVELLTEESGPGTGFLPDVCKEWEEATRPASEKGIRVVNIRIGIVLSTKGGALAKMLPPFQMGVGGRIGSGKQYWSWIDLEDVVGVIEHVTLQDQTLSGAVNTCTPNPVTNAEFTEALAQVLKRPALFPIPAFAARGAFGEMADALLLASARMEPAKLLSTGYNFAFPDLQSSLRHLLMK